jgi:hypothetical protein
MKRGVFTIKEGKNGASNSGKRQSTLKMVDLLHQMRGSAIRKDPLVHIRELKEQGYSQ